MLDRQTEIIAHFIGAFNQTTEKLAARQDYDAFRAARLSEPDAGDLLTVEIRVSSDYALEGYGPGLNFDAPPPLPPEAPWLPVAQMPDRILPDLGLLPPPSYKDAPGIDLPVMTPPPNFYLLLDPPGSVITITAQVNTLVDQDVLVNRPFEMPPELLGSYGPEASAAKLTLLAEAGDALSVATPELGTSAADHAGMLIDAMEELDPQAVGDGVEAALFRASPIQPVPEPVSEDEGETVEAVPAPPLLGPGFDGSPVINGVLAEAIPETLKERLESRNAEDETEDGGDIPGIVEVEDEAAGTVSGQSAEPVPIEITQSLETGDNLALNQYQAAHEWIDAPVIAVAGSAQSLSLISQVNVMRDQDLTDVSAPGLISAAALPADPASQAVNAASFTQEANPAQFLDLDIPGGEKMVGLVRIEGDVTVDNHLTQVNAISDGDLVSYEFGPYQTEITMGGNAAVNLETLLEYGMKFDVILIGGDLIEIAQIEQINVLLDDDLILSDPPMGETAGGSALVQSHDNLLWNEASLTKIGIDAQMEMSARFQATLDKLADLAEGERGATPSGAAFDAVKELFDDPLLAGLDALRVLWIEGDLIVRDTLTQINLLDDADLVSVGGGGPEGIAVETGDNILGNVAGLTVAGVDSTIMAGEGVYSDAVIWQAGMLDEGPPGLGIGNGLENGQGHGNGNGNGALASEAVVFLADGMIEARPNYDDEDFQTGPGSQGVAHGAGASLDALHGVLA
ncbi:hypothetical protein [Thioclava pacifica]|uniref:Uncharacterized protein n=1 Tax=Thioclava pacifica DSM 10166 TaxID=1353537 RepID=A0A074JDR1_9RHOB|nr:hypothetical protein [Thioclava pacifica]KEO53985.1 hypothetical protein TP2_03480 [Thioclava pacifica DSM 10166]